MRRPMPSPRGTNRAGLFLVTNPRGAYDAALSEASGAQLVAFLTSKLSEEDLAEFCKLAGIDAGLGMDNPEPFNGMPRPGGGKFGQDARYRRPMTAAQEASFAERFPHAARIKVSY
jgi:hypothetical protein